jgi:Zn-finger nucleic acid-binding protein
MSCPVCGHTMGRLCIHEGMSFDLCERCGTVTVTILDANLLVQSARIYVPKLVERCRQFEKSFPPGNPPTVSYSDWWKRLGIAESINRPEDRR